MTTFILYFLISIVIYKEVNVLSKKVGRPFGGKHSEEVRKYWREYMREYRKLKKEKENEQIK